MLKKLGVLFIVAFTFLNCSTKTQISAPVAPPKPIYELQPADRVTISAVGDIMIHDAQLKSAWDAENNCYNFEPVFSQVKDFLSASDLTIVNLETTLPGTEKPYSGYPQFGSPDTIVSALQKAGVDIVNTANNHACDKGKLGLTRTIEVLDAYGLMHVGTYSNETTYEAQRILIVERNNIRLVFLSYAYGLNDMPIPQGSYVNLIDRKKMTEDITLAKEKNPDFIIVLIHYGTEYKRYPDRFQKETTEFLLQEGADIVLGTHPHVLQPFELKSVTDKYGDIKPRLVIYSLGNFISSQRSRYRDGGIIFNFTLQKHYSLDKSKILSIKDLNYIPTWVYVQNINATNKFHILPIPKYLENDQPLKLPYDAYQKMLNFYKDTLLHLPLSPNNTNSEIELPLSNEK